MLPKAMQIHIKNQQIKIYLGPHKKLKKALLTSIT